MLSTEDPPTVTVIAPRRGVHVNHSGSRPPLRVAGAGHAVRPCRRLRVQLHVLVGEEFQ